eukprot:Sspe_Gene.92456::Locus_64735_Transcript_1_1_Confidence_1.000_Length_819::g.92456::m.92456
MSLRPFSSGLSFPMAVVHLLVAAVVLAVATADKLPIMELADEGDMTAQEEMAAAHIEAASMGQGSFETARMWAEKAAAQGSERAMKMMARLSLQGEGGPQSDEDAVKWWERCAEK